MLIEFRVKNFLSIQDEQVLSLVANDDKQLKDNTFQASNLTLLKSVAIYGANAAGKSNVIKAMKIMQEIVLPIWQNRKRGDIIPGAPFLLGDNKHEVLEFEVSFIAKDVQEKEMKYTYGFQVTRERILKEWLFAYPNDIEQKWFIRTYNQQQNEYEYKFENFIDTKEANEKTIDNVLFLDAAVQWNNKQLQPIYDWFRTINISSFSRNSFIFENALGFSMGILQEKKEEFLEYFRDVDLDIENIMLKNAHDIYMTHLNQRGQPIELPFTWESDGTQRFFEFLGPIIDTLEKGMILVVDELHNHFHPMMTKYIIQLFHNKQINKKNAQLIFTTHETSVLDNEIFRKDQIYFCEKVNKATQLYSISDFDGLREDIDFEKSYLLGRFGALPDIDYTNVAKEK